MKKLTPTETFSVEVHFGAKVGPFGAHIGPMLVVYTTKMGIHPGKIGIHAGFPSFSV